MSQMYDTHGTESGNLIGSDRVEGTPVFNLGGERIGSIDSVMLDKKSGRVAHAVMRFGGFLGIGQDYYPIPWSKLDYDESLGGYRVDVTEDQLSSAPSYSSRDETDWYTRSNEERVFSHYGVPPYWV